MSLYPDSHTTGLARRSPDHNGLCEHLLPALEKVSRRKHLLKRLKKIPVENAPTAPLQKPQLETIKTFLASNAFEHPAKSFRDPLRNGEPGPEMVVIRAVRFLMGSAQGECYDSEKPQHEVILPQAFAMGRYPVTFADYDVFAQQSSSPLRMITAQGAGRATGDQRVLRKRQHLSNG